MTGVEAALAAMDTAEQEAHDHLDGDDPQDVEYGTWASDRLRLIQRDKATLQRHSSRRYEIPLPDSQSLCAGCTVSSCSRYLDQCPERRAVIDHWTQENA